MAVDDTAPRAQRPGPIALADLFDAALKDLVPKPNADAPPPKTQAEELAPVTPGMAAKS